MQQFSNNYKGIGSSKSYKVSFEIDGELCSGYIIDKYRDVIYVETNISYGSGISKRNNPITVDFYIIYNKELDETYNVRCNLIKSFKENDSKKVKSDKEALG